MSANTFGHLFRVTSFGESHGVGLGAVIDGCPAGLDFDEDLLRQELRRRRPGQSEWVTPRSEEDVPEILSGVFSGKTLGTPISILVRNKDARSQDYEQVRKSPRVGHADDVWIQKFSHVDPRGGGRSSGRETIARAMAGAVAKMLIRRVAPGLVIRAWAESLGPYTLTENEREQFLSGTSSVDAFPLRFPSDRANEVATRLGQVRDANDSWGGVVRVQIDHAPMGLGQPVFHKLKADLAAAMMGIGATSAFVLGEGTHQSGRTGRTFHQSSSGKVYGGIRGGISTGDPVDFSVHFKPTSSIGDVAAQGRHDPCIVIRAVPVVESMASLVLAEHLLWARLDQVNF